MDDTAFRALIIDCAKGLNDLNTFIETRFELVENLGIEGEDSGVDEARETWTAAWETLNGALRTSVAQELHDIMMPVAADDVLELSLV